MADTKGFLDHVKNRKSANTLIAYSETVARFDEFTKRHGYALDKRTVEAFLDYMTAKRASPRTLNRHLSAIKSLYKYLGIELRVESFRIPSRLPVYLDDDEIERFYASTRTPFEIMIAHCLIGAGLRLSELHDLKIIDIDLRRGVVNIIGKGDKQRLVATNQHVVDALKSYIKTLEPDATMLVPRHRSSIYKTVRAVAKRAAINKPISPHKLRHSYASAYIRHGGNILELRDQLGHTNISTTNTYLHTSIQDRVKNLPKGV